MTDTPNLGLPYLLAAQSQKHVTHNDAIRALDALVQIAVQDRNLAAPPASPMDGDRYIVAASPTGAWAGQAGKVAAFQDGAWMFYTAKEGWLAWVADENIEVVFDGVAWVALVAGGGGGVTDHGALTGLTDDDHTQYLNNARGDARYTPLNPAMLGINATADATNKLAVGSAASLFNHTGTGGHQIKINKAASADTASFLFQTGFSGRAELGTTGDDDFHFKVSANGTAWNDAILINRSTGACSFPGSNLGTAQPTVQTFTASGTWTKPTGCKRIRVRAVGGGGGGAGATAAASAACCGGGGGAGASAEGIFDVTATASISVTIGSGGAAGAAANGAGGTGGITSFGALLSCPGGLGGAAMTSGTTVLTVAGGNATANPTGGAINAGGQGGTPGIRSSGTTANGGSGGASAFGGGGRGSTTAAAGATASANSGAGGAGAVSTSATGFAGGAGGSGLVVVEEYY